MDRFSWSSGDLVEGESKVAQQTGVRLYDGESKTNFDNGIAMLTTHNLLWRDPKDPECIIALPLSLIVYIEEQPSGFAKSAKIVCHLHALKTSATGPINYSKSTYIKLSFRESGELQFHRSLSEVLSSKLWEKAKNVSKSRVGITGIQRNLEQKAKATDKDISQSFKDLSVLVNKAKDMVTLSKTISEKIRQKKGEITDDETVRFKSYLLSMGIADPVTRETHGTGNKYYVELAKQLATMLEKSVEDSGGMMTLTDAYCRVNRARGMELLSPEDLVNGCRQMESLGSSLRLQVFDSGVMVLRSRSQNESEMIRLTSDTVDERGSLTADELSSILGVSVILSRERLLLAEKAGSVCRDESIEGLRFYPNAFTRDIDTSEWITAQ